MKEKQCLLNAIDITIEESKQISSINKAALFLRDVFEKGEEQTLEITIVEDFFRNILEVSSKQQENLRNIAVDALFCIVVIQYLDERLDYDNYEDSLPDLVSSAGIQQFMLHVFLDKRTQLLLKNYPESWKHESTLVVELHNKATSKKISIKPGKDTIENFHLYLRGIIPLPLTRPYATDPLDYIDCPPDKDYRRTAWINFCKSHPFHKKIDSRFLRLYKGLLDCEEPNLLCQKNCFIILIDYLKILCGTIYSCVSEGDTLKSLPVIYETVNTVAGGQFLLEYRGYLNDPSKFQTLLHSGTFFHDCGDPSHLFHGSSVLVEVLKELQSQYYKGVLSEENVRIAGAQVWLMIRNAFLTFIASNFERLSQMPGSEIERIEKLRFLIMHEACQKVIWNRIDDQKRVCASNVIQTAVRIFLFLNKRIEILKHSQTEEKSAKFIIKIYEFLRSDAISKEIFLLRFQPKIDNQLFSIIKKHPPSDLALYRWFQYNYTKMQRIESSQNMSPITKELLPLDYSSSNIQESIEEIWRKIKKNGLIHEVVLLKKDPMTKRVGQYVQGAILEEGRLLSSQALLDKKRSGMMTPGDKEVNDDELVSFSTDRLALNEKSIVAMTVTVNLDEKHVYIKWVDWHLIKNFISSFYASEPKGPPISVALNSKPKHPILKSVFLSSHDKYPGMLTVNVNERVSFNLKILKHAYYDFLSEKFNNKTYGKSGNCRLIQKNEKKMVLVKIVQQLIIFFMPLHKLPRKDIQLIAFCEKTLKYRLLRTNTKKLKSFLLPKFLLGERTHHPMLFERLTSLIMLVLKKSDNSLLTNSILNKSKQQTVGWLNQRVLRHCEFNAIHHFDLNLKTLLKITFNATNELNLTPLCCVDIKQLLSCLRNKYIAEFSELIESYVSFFYDDTSLNNGRLLFDRLKRMFSAYSGSTMYQQLILMGNGFEKDLKIYNRLLLTYGARSVGDTLDLFSCHAKRSFPVMKIFLNKHPELYSRYSESTTWKQEYPKETENIEIKFWVSLIGKNGIGVFVPEEFRNHPEIEKAIQQSLPEPLFQYN